jgi:hypothetical protein
MHAITLSQPVASARGITVRSHDAAWFRRTGRAYAPPSVPRPARSGAGCRAGTLRPPRSDPVAGTAGAFPGRLVPAARRGVRHDQRPVRRPPAGQDQQPPRHRTHQHRGHLPRLDAVARTPRAVHARQLLGLGQSSAEEMYAEVERYCADGWRPRAEIVEHIRGWLAERGGAASTETGTQSVIGGIPGCCAGPGTRTGSAEPTPSTEPPARCCPTSSRTLPPTPSATWC